MVVGAIIELLADAGVAGVGALGGIALNAIWVDVE